MEYNVQNKILIWKIYIIVPIKIPIWKLTKVDFIYLKTHENEINDLNRKSYANLIETNHNHLI